MSAPDAGDRLAQGVARVRAAGLVAYPTETLFGLGADATSERAVERLRAWKGRAADAPLSILVAEPACLAGLGFEVSDAAARLAAALWPGPLTLVLRCTGRFARGVARADGAVGVRCSPHPVAAALARRLAAEGVGPVTATSLNRSGEPPASSRAQARAFCGAGAQDPLLVDDPATPEPDGRPSTVVDLSGPEPVVLREGCIDAAALTAALGRALRRQAAGGGAREARGA